VEGMAQTRSAIVMIAVMQERLSLRWIMME
jgi:hypothetical protein